LLNLLGVIAFLVVTSLPEKEPTKFLKKPGSHVIGGAIEQIIWCQQVVEESTSLANFDESFSMKGTERDLFLLDACFFWGGNGHPNTGLSWWVSTNPFERI